MNHRNFHKINAGNIILLVLLVILAGCSSSGTRQNEKPDDLGLKDYYKEYFPVGVAVSPGALKRAEGTLIKKHFISMTPENVMKSGPIHPEEARYNWEPADQIVAFARKNGMMMRGHTLCWHNQTPDWMFITAGGKEVSGEVLLKRLEAHITSVVDRYKDDVYSWDVVNEAISDKPGEFLRDSKWLQIIGEEYIARAFEYARAADPDAQLFYNDYNVIDSVKREKIYRLVKGLKESGVPIDGVGIQGHWSIYEPSEEVLRATIERFASLGLQVQITELDVSVYPKEHSRREKRPEDEKDNFTPEQEARQAEMYKMFFRVFRDYEDVLGGVTFWNISDKHSWLDEFPVAGRKDYPLLFDQDLRPKRAYQEVVNF